MDWYYIYIRKTARSVETLFLLILAIGVYSQNDTALQTDICKKCTCKDETVDCFDLGIDTFFNEDEWAVLTEFKPKIVDLSKNPIQNVTVIADLPIRVLNLSGCNIKSIARGSFKNLQQMEVLDLSHNQLSLAKIDRQVFEGRHSSDKIEPLSFKTLNLSYNGLHSLETFVFEGRLQLELLDLSGNPLTTHFSTWYSLAAVRNLTDLRLRSCQLSTIPKYSFRYLRRLKRLDISDNKLSAIPQELDNTRNLKYLNLDQNPIEEIEANSEDNPGFPPLYKLKELRMSNMSRLRSVGSSSLGGLESLEILHMSFNPTLSNLDPHALASSYDDKGKYYVWPMVKELYLQSNNLTQISYRFLSRWDLLEKVDVSDNPFLCDCSTRWMMNVLVTEVDSKGGNSSLMTCAQPSAVRGYTLRQFREAQGILQCLNMGVWIGGVIIGVVFSLVIVLFVVLCRGCFGLRARSLPTESPAYHRAPVDDKYK